MAKATRPTAQSAIKSPTPCHGNAWLSHATVIRTRYTATNVPSVKAPSRRKPAEPRNGGIIFVVLSFGPTFPLKHSRDVGSIYRASIPAVVLRLVTRAVGVREVADHIWLISFMHYDVGFFDDETSRVECAPNPFSDKVSTMCPV